MLNVGSSFSYRFDAPILGWGGDGNHIAACPRYPVAKLFLVITTLKLKWIERLEQDQTIPSCCRHPENHDISAWYSTQAIADTGVPDVYHFHCTCGAKHRFFCLGLDDTRPVWEVR